MVPGCFPGPIRPAEAGAANSGLFAFIPPPKGSGCSRSGYKKASRGWRLLVLLTSRA